MRASEDTALSSSLERASRDLRRDTRIDTGFAKLFVAINGAVPIALLAWDTFQHRLGVNGVNFAIHTTGILALTFLLLSLVVTPLRKVLEIPSLIAVRRSLGLYAFFYLCVHFAIFFGFDRAASVSSTLHEIFVRRYLQLGTLGLLLLVPLAVTSTDAMITRLGPRRWKQLHGLVYFAAALGSVHYVLLVKADLRQPLAFAAALGVLLGFRVIQGRGDAQRKILRQLLAPPAKRFWSGDLKVLEIIQETPDVKTFRLTLDGSTELPFAHEPGQYLNLSLLIDGKRINRSYTIASSPARESARAGARSRAGTCEVTIKREGLASSYLHDSVEEGSIVAVSAPAGRFVFTGANAEGVVLLAGGVGITPLMAILRYLTDRVWPGQIHLIFSVRNEEDLIFSAELAELQRNHPNLHVHLTLTGAKVGDSWTGGKGRISAELLGRAVPNLITLPIYLCGPDAMMTQTRALLLSLGVAEDRIKTEAFLSAATVALEMPTDGVAADRETMAMAATALQPGETAVVSFRRSLQMVEISAEKSILEAAEEIGLEIPFECRSGICGQCKTRLLAGRVTMDVDDALTAEERAAGIILACQAHAASDIAVEA